MIATMVELKNLFSTKQVAKMFGVDSSRIRQLVMEDPTLGTIFGRDRYFSKHDIQRLKKRSWQKSRKNSSARSNQG